MTPTCSVCGKEVLFCDDGVFVCYRHPSDGSEPEHQYWDCE